MYLHCESLYTDGRIHTCLYKHGYAHILHYIFPYINTTHRYLHIYNRTAHHSCPHMHVETCAHTCACTHARVHEHARTVTCTHKLSNAAHCQYTLSFPAPLLLNNPAKVQRHRHLVPLHLKTPSPWVCGRVNQTKPSLQGGQWKV